MAAPEGGDAFATFASWADWRTFPWSLIVWIPLTWAVFQHTLSGLRHLVMDLGAGFELSTNKFWANMTIVGSALLTVALWAGITWGRGRGATAPKPARPPWAACAASARPAKAPSIGGTSG